MLVVNVHGKPPTSDGHYFFVRTPFWVFLDSMEIPLSQDSSHIPMEDIRLTLTHLNIGFSRSTTRIELVN